MRQFTGQLTRSFVAHTPTARCALSQNSGELPNSRASRSDISGLTARRPRSSSLIDWRETLKASAKRDTVRP
jgi:hypothetical protein